MNMLSINRNLTRQITSTLSSAAGTGANLAKAGLVCTAKSCAGVALTARSVFSLLADRAPRNNSSATPQPATGVTPTPATTEEAPTSPEPLTEHINTQAAVQADVPAEALQEGASQESSHEEAHEAAHAASAAALGAEAFTPEASIEETPVTTDERQGAIEPSSSALGD
jgi:hypothetical protein